MEGRFSPKYNIEVFHRLLDLTRQHRFSFALTIFLGWMGGLAAILQAWYLSRVIRSVFLGDQTLAQVIPYVIVLVLVALVRALVVGGSEVSANHLALQVKSNARVHLLSHLAALGPAFTQGEKAGELSSTVVEGVEALDSYFSQYLPQVVLAAFIPLSVLLVVFPLDPLTGVVFLLTAPMIPILMILIGKAGEVVTKRQWDGLSHLSAYLLDVLQGLTTMKFLGQARRQEGLIREASDSFRDGTMQVLRVTFLSALVLEMLSMISIALVAVEVSLRLLRGGLPFQDALFILVLAPDFYLPMRLLGLRFHAGMSGTEAARRIFGILDTPVAVSTPGSHPGTTASFSITFSSVSYTYQSRGYPALDGVSFDIPEGKITALVGVSGAGKSTITALLLRFMEPEKGTIFLGDRPLSDLPAQDWRQSLAWVPQTPYLFNGTLLSNLQLARPDASKKEMADACQRAGLDAFIHSQPNGLETVIGEWGLRLSGGEAQRLALARAFLRQAPFLILDEPTSSLDPNLEAQFQEAVQGLVKGVTTLVIAHRLNTVRLADQVVVLAEGRVVETGTHAELAHRRGEYARLVNRQTGMAS